MSRHKKAKRPILTLPKPSPAPNPAHEPAHEPAYAATGAAPEAAPAQEQPPAAPAPTEAPAPAAMPAPEAAAPMPASALAPEPAPAPPPPPPPVWLAQYEAVVGLSHRNMQPPLPCQDAALARVLPRPLVIVADGAGSSAVSELGAQAVVGGLARLLHTLDRQVAQLLDEPAQPRHEETGRNLALLLVKHAKGLLDDLAATHRRALRDFRCTLLLAVAGRAQMLWLKVGDGALVLQRRASPALAPHPEATPQESGLSLQVLGHEGKGEFANQTQFVDDSLRPDAVQSALVPAADIAGLVAMSDGAAEKLVSHDGQRVAGQIGLWLDALRQDRLPRRTLTRSFYSDSFCSGSTGDDCSLALLARALPG